MIILHPWKPSSIASQPPKWLLLPFISRNRICRPLFQKIIASDILSSRSGWPFIGSFVRCWLSCRVRSDEQETSGFSGDKATEYLLSNFTLLYAVIR